MIIRTKSGEMMTANGGALLEFLGVKNAKAGLLHVESEVLGLAGVTVSSEEASTKLTEAGSKGEGFAWTLSTYDLDRFGERIDPAGWDIAGYIHNPVVQWSHLHMIPAIGKTDGLVVDDNGLHGRVIFNGKDYDFFGWSIGQRVAAGVIRAGSVGFRIIEIEIPDRETARDGTSLIIRKQELCEFSICNVPANPFALTKTNEQLAVSNESGVNAPLFWGSLINNFQGA